MLRSSSGGRCLGPGRQASDTSTMSSAYFVGLDLSTQALKASLLDASLRGVDEVSVRFDVDVPEFGTSGGVLRHGHALLDEPEAVAAPVDMYVAAMDVLWDRIAEKWPVDRIVALSAAGQQHASVYWAQGATDLLRDVEADAPLRPQLAGAFSRAIVPNWQDATTLDECAELMRWADTTGGMCEVTGSMAHTRFTGAQILRWRRRHPEQYARTERIALVSNFVTTLLLAGGADARIAPLDQSDACGMNLWDMRSRTWSQPLLAMVDGAHAGVLEAKLGHVVLDPRVPVGRVGTWLQRRYGLSSSCLVCQATGDNPATLQCLTPRMGEAVISLGTSDTVLLPSQVYTPDPTYHIFAHPVTTGEAHGTPPYFLVIRMRAAHGPALMRRCSRLPSHCSMARAFSGCVRRSFRGTHGAFTDSTSMTSRSRRLRTHRTMCLRSCRASAWRSRRASIASSARRARLCGACMSSVAQLRTSTCASCSRMCSAATSRGRASSAALPRRASACRTTTARSAPPSALDGYGPSCKASMRRSRRA